MGLYSYHAREAGSGREVYGVIDASSADAAKIALQGRNLFVLKIKEKTAHRISLKRSVSLIDLATFTRQLSSMLDAGLTISQSLITLSTQASNKKFANLLTDMIKKIDAGETFSGALQSHPDVFNRLYVNMVNAGERGGILPEILARLATYMERSQKAQSKVKSAMMYPSVVLFIAAGIICFLMIQVVPTFGDIFNDMGAKLPVFTLFVIGIANFLKLNIWIILGCLFFGLLIGRFFFCTETGKELWDSVKIKLPIVGPIFHKLALSRFARTTSSLIHSGVPILEVFNVVATTVDHIPMEKALKDVITKVEKGEAISTAIAAHPIFPSLIVRMIAAGEQSGSVDDMLERLADYMDDELENTLSGLTSLIEPLLIVFLGIVIGGMVLAMFLPIFDLINHIR